MLVMARRGTLLTALITSLTVLMTGLVTPVHADSAGGRPKATAATADAVVPQFPGGFVPVTPARLVDTRTGFGGVSSPAAGATASVTVVGRAGLPASSVAAVSVTLTVAGATGPGNLSTFADGAAVPPTSDVNFVAGQTIATSVTVPVGADGKIDIYNGSSGTTPFVIDVTGYYLAGPATQAGMLVPVSPARFLDTRSGGAAPAGGSVVSIPIVGRGAIPITGVAAVLVTLTAVSPASSGFLTAYPADQPRPATSNVNFVRGLTIANTTLVPVGASGAVRVYIGSPGSVQIIVDIKGYVRAGDPILAGAFAVQTSRRLVDTRIGTGDVSNPAGSVTVPVTVAGRAGVPTASVAAVTIVLTVAGATAAGYLTTYADGSDRPGTSDINFVPGQTIATTVTVPVGPDGRIAVFNGSSGTTPFVVDVVGYIRSAPIAAAPLTWSAPMLFDQPLHGSLQVMSCPSVSFCVAGDAHGNVSTYDGSRWGSPLPLVGPQSAVTGVSCPTTNSCVAIDAAGEYVVMSGSNWGHPATIGNHGLTAISCGAPLDCLVTDDQGDHFHLTAQGAAQLSQFPFLLSTYTCQSSSFCLGVSSGGQLYTFDGHIWTQVVPPETRPNDEVAYQVSCLSVHFCLAMTDRESRTFNGTTWSSPIPLTVNTLGPVSCASPTYCVVTDPSSSSSLLFDGSRWSTGPQISPPDKFPPNFMYSMSCFSLSGGNHRCLTLGEFYFYIFDGTSWTSDPFVGYDNEIGALSCAAPSFCLVGDGQRQQFTNSGDGWSPQKSSNPSPTADHWSVDCLSAISCYALGTDFFTEHAYHFNGIAWIEQPLPGAEVGSQRDLSNLSCIGGPVGDRCVGFDGHGDALEFDGESWHRSVEVDAYNREDIHVSCPDVDYCLAIDDGGYYFIFDGSAWAPHDVDQGLGYANLSCASRYFCISSWGNAMSYYDGSVWRWMTAMGTDGADSVSCTQTAMCVAIGQAAGDVALQFDRRAWQPGISLGVHSYGSLLPHLSCADDSYCVSANRYNNSVSVGIASGP